MQESSSFQFVIGYITAKNEEEAEEIAKILVQSKLIACANIIPSIKSVYIWEGNLNKDSETLMIIKTTKDNINKVIETVKSSHSYQVPEVIFTDIIDGNKDYLKWVAEIKKK